MTTAEISFKSLAMIMDPIFQIGKSSMTLRLRKQLERL